MADNVGQDLEVKGSTYRIPKMEDVADAVVAFTDYSESIPYSEYIKTRVVADSGRAVESVTEEDNGTMIVVQVDTTLQFGDLPEGFSVACVADAGATITYQGVDKNGQQSTQYQVATVVTVGGLNILSLASPYDGEIGGDGGGDGSGGIALGTPPAPVFVDKDGNEDASGGSVIYFTAGEPDENQAPAIFYSAKIRRQDGAELTTEILTMDQENMEVAVAGTEPFVDYVVDVYGINEEGKGETASTNPFQLNYNKATGGSESIVENYNASGEKWKVHTFTPQTADKNFVVESSPKTDWRVLVVAGGGGSGSGKDGGSGSGGGAAGQAFMLEDQEIEEYPYTLIIGAGGPLAPATGHNQQSIGGAGGKSEFPGIKSASGGAGGGNTGSGGHNNWGDVYRPPATPGTPITSNITGSSQQYSQGEGGSVPGSGAAAQSKPGKDGRVIIAYQIGTSTTRQIEQAQAEADARQAGVEQGIGQGYYQAQEDLQEELTSLRTQLLSVGTTDV